MEGGGPSEPVHIGNTVKTGPTTTEAITITLRLFRDVFTWRFALYTAGTDALGL